MEDAGRQLVATGFDEAAVTEILGSVPSIQAAPVGVRRLLPHDARAVLVQLFVLGEAVSATELPVDADVLEEAGLVEREGELVRAPLRLTPDDGLLVAYDRDERLQDEDYVPGVGNSSRTLASLTVREPADRVLDAGTGCGIQALLASRHAGAVIATDLSRRALHYADLNCRLNRATIELREGSWFEPVRGESFDLIVANPPFVISPSNRYVFRDSGSAGEAVAREIVRTAATHLRQGGHATILCNWVCPNAGEVWEPLEEWTEGTGCDALLLANEPVSPLRYADGYNDPLRRDTPAFERVLEQWLEYYEQQDIRAICYGAVVLRRRDGNNWRRGYKLTRPAAGAAGPHLLRLFAAADSPVTDAELLAGRFRLIPGHRLDQSLVYQDEYILRDVTLSLENSAGLTASVDARALPALFALEATHPLGKTLTDAGIRAADTLPTFRRLYELGLIERA